MRHASSLFCPVLWTSVAPFCGSTTASFPRTQAERSFSAGLSLFDADLVVQSLLRLRSLRCTSVCEQLAPSSAAGSAQGIPQPACRAWCPVVRQAHKRRKRTRAKEKKRVVRSGLRGGRGSPPQQGMLLCLFAAALGDVKALSPATGHPGPHRSPRSPRSCPTC